MTRIDKRAAGVAGALLAAGLAGFAAARWTAEAPGTTAPPPTAGAKPSDTVAMYSPAIAATGIALETVTADGLDAEIVTTATVAPSPDGEALVTARAAGTVTRLFKRLGDTVRAGEPLAIVQSRDAAGIAAERSVAGAKLALAQKALARERFLYRERVSAKVDLERAEAEAATAAAELQRSRSAAAAAGVTRDGQGVVVSSPIAGRIGSASITLSAFVQPDAELFRIADARRVQVEAALSAGDAPRVAAGDKAVIELPQGGSVEARVRTVTSVLNGETRSATAVLDPAGALQPGLAVKVRLLPRRGAASAAIALPEEAVQSLGGRDTVFVRTTTGFRAVPVLLGRRSAGRVEIVAGLKPGQRVATRNAFLLKSELAKSEEE